MQSFFDITVSIEQMHDVIGHLIWNRLNFFVCFALYTAPTVLTLVEQTGTGGTRPSFLAKEAR